MSRWLRDPRSSWLVVAALLLLLAILATLQYRWLGEVSQAQRERMRAGLESATGRLVRDFDSELTRAFLQFQSSSWTSPSDGSTLAGFYSDQLDHWTETAPHPELIREILKISSAAGTQELHRLDPTAAAFESIEWRESLDGVAQLVDVEAPGRGRFGGGPPFSFLAPEIPAVLVPRFDFGLMRSPPAGRPDPRSLIRELVVVQLDVTFIREVYLPLLGSRYLSGGDGGLEYRFAVMAAENADDPWIFRSDPELSPDHYLAADHRAVLFDLLPPEELRRIWHEVRRGERGDPPTATRGGRRGRPYLPGGFGGPREAFERGGRWHAGRGNDGGGYGWRLLVRHREGSLEASVARAQRRSLFVGFGVLLLLGLTVLMLLAATRRAQGLASQQVEFVAGITHELRTPLAAIRSLAQNLADGIVEKPGQAKRYGSLIEREGSRLSSMVEQVLELSGILSGRQSYDFEIVGMTEIVELAIADCQPQIVEKGCRIEKRFSEVPRLRADASALRRAIQNLVANAVKYGGDGGEIGVEVSVAERKTTSALGRQGSAEIMIRVSDRGRGISRDEIPHLFEAFFRGRDAAADQTPGSGLGLSLVEHVIRAHEGRIEVDSEPGVGSTFTIYLPAVAGKGSDDS